MSKPVHIPFDADRQAFIDGIFAANKALYGDMRMEVAGDGASGAAAGGDGAAGAAGDAAGTAAGAANGAAGDSGTGDAANGGQQATAWNPDAWDGKVETLPKAAQKMLNDLRKEDGDERVSKKTLDAVLKILNPDAENEPGDPVKLAKALADSQVDGKSTKVELAVLKAAIKAGADTEALTDSRAFMSQVAGLDPTAADFEASVTTAVTDAVKNNPKLKAALVAGQSSVDHAGGSGEGDHTLDAQIADAEKKGDHALAISLKRQKAYGVKQ